MPTLFIRKSLMSINQSTNQSYVTINHNDNLIIKLIKNNYSGDKMLDNLIGSSKYTLSLKEERKWRNLKQWPVNRQNWST